MSSDAPKAPLSVDATRKQLAGYRDQLRQLWEKIHQTQIVIKRSQDAYQESIGLLAQIDAPEFKSTD